MKVCGLSSRTGAADPAFGDQAAKLLLPGAEIVDGGDRIDGHEADIVPVQRILRAGITEAGPDLHAR
jgi:hypothetical protein